MYTTPLSTLISSFFLDHHLYSALLLFPPTRLLLKHFSSPKRSLADLFLSWSYRQLLSAHKYIVSHRIVSCLSVCLSVTSRCSTKMAIHRILKTTPHDSPETLFYDAKDIYESPIGSPPKGAPNGGEVGKSAFVTGQEVSRPDKNLCLPATVVRVHDGALEKEYAVSSTSFVV